MDLPFLDHGLVKAAKAKATAADVHDVHGWCGHYVAMHSALVRVKEGKSKGASWEDRLQLFESFGRRLQKYTKGGMSVSEVFASERK